MQSFCRPVTTKVKNRNVCHQSNTVIPPLLPLRRDGGCGDDGWGRLRRPGFRLRNVGPLWSPAVPLIHLNPAHLPVRSQSIMYKHQDMAAASDLQPDWM